MTDWKERACEAIDRSEGVLRDVSLDLFEHPELKLEETRAAKRLADELEQRGFDVERGLAGLDTAVRGVHPASSSGPAVAILAEYDALPELGHACGHNLIAAGALGAALAVGSIKEELPGRLVFLGTPGEEGGGGKVTMVEANVFDDIDAAMMYHPAPFSVTGWGTLAITEVRLEFYGQAAHASASPEAGINALDAVIQTFNGLNALRQHILDGARVHGIITHGGAKPNIVPDYAAAEFYVRAPDSAYRDVLLDKLRACAEGAAQATGARLEFSTVGHSYKAMRPNRALGACFERNLGGLGYTFAASPPSAMGSSDMGDVTCVVPGIHPFVAVCDPGTALHTREFAEIARSERAQRVMLDVAKAMAMTTIDVLTNPELAAAMKEEFAHNL